MPLFEYQSSSAEKQGFGLAFQVIFHKIWKEMEATTAKKPVVVKCFFTPFLISQSAGLKTLYQTKLK